LHQRSERKRYFNCFDFTDEKMQACLRYLKKWQPDCLVGYTNPLVELARLALKNGGAGFSVGSILTAAEKLHPVQRDLLVEAFGGDVFETYGSREFMLIGSECNHHNGLHVSAENLIVEVVDENGHPVPAGSTGRLLITDLNNYGMPFIRYEVGDMARASDKVCECGRGLPLLDGIVGRSLDILRAPSGKVIPGEYFVYFMMDFEEISRYQVVQRQLDRLELRLQSKHPLSKQTLENIHQRISAGLDSTINLDIVTDAEISLTPTGKHRVTISELDATA
jgi:phenylacetate-CoA ligase